MVGRVKGGQEIISILEDINTTMVGWTSSSWWDGVRIKDLVACGKCDEQDDYVWSEDKPDLCR